jgi:acyl-coenzyme A synthetase/AMP-(fatty) acid ligase
MLQHPAKIRLLNDIIKHYARVTPDKTALICENSRVTFNEIDGMSDRLANALVKNGIERGDRVLFYLMNGVELVVSFFAVLKANAICSVNDYANNLETLQKIASDCEAKCIITFDYHLDAVHHLLETTPSLRFAVLTGHSTGNTDPKILSFENILQNYPPECPVQQSIDCDIAYLLYTSGSTGVNKGVLTSHRSALFNVESSIDLFHIDEDVIHALPLPISFAPGMNQFLYTMRMGGTLVLEKSFAFPNVVLKRMAAEKVTGMGCVPTILSIMMNMELSKYDLSSLRYMVSSGAVVPPSIIQMLHDKLPDVSFYSMYGMAEASCSLCLDPAQLSVRPTSVGKPFPGMEGWIEDEEGTRLGPNEYGELVMRGTHVRSGYWNDPESSARRFKNGLLPGELICHTGDVFTIDNEGYFYFVARKDEIIKSGAKKVVPKEIENALYKMDGVIEAAAIGVPDDLLGKVIKAFVVFSEEYREKVFVDDIMHHCTKTLEAFKVPKYIEILDSLPKTSSGKIKKTDLR